MLVILWRRLDDVDADLPDQLFDGSEPFPVFLLVKGSPVRGMERGSLVKQFETHLRDLSHHFEDFTCIGHFRSP